MSASGLQEIQSRLGYQFRHPALLRDALTHTSYFNELGESGESDNERLEFLGDAVLNLVTSEYLLTAFPDAAEGILSKLRARLVSEETLTGVARRLGLGAALRLGKGETITQGKDKPSILADALEAVLASIYLDGGLQAAEMWIKTNFAEEFAACDQSVGGWREPTAWRGARSAGRVTRRQRRARSISRPGGNRDTGFSRAGKKSGSRMPSRGRWRSFCVRWKTGTNRRSAGAIIWRRLPCARRCTRRRRNGE